MNPARVKRRSPGAAGALCLLALLAGRALAGGGGPGRTYANRLTPIRDPRPLLADYPEFVKPIKEVARFEAFLASSAIPDSGRLAQRVTLTVIGGSDMVVLQDDAIKADPAVTQWIMSREFSVRLEGLETGKEFSIMVNRHFLRDAVAALAVGPSERLEIGFHVRLGPIQIKPEGVENRFVLVMPFDPACA